MDIHPARAVYTLNIVQFVFVKAHVERTNTASGLYLVIKLLLKAALITLSFIIRQNTRSSIHRKSNSVFAQPSD